MERKKEREWKGKGEEGGRREREEDEEKGRRGRKEGEERRGGGWRKRGEDMVVTTKVKGGIISIARGNVRRSRICTNLLTQN